MLEYADKISGAGEIYSEITGKFKVFKIIDPAVSILKISNAISKEDYLRAGMETGKTLIGIAYGTEMFIGEQLYNISQSSYMQTQIGRAQMEEVHYWVNVAKLYERAGNTEGSDKAWNNAAKAEKIAIQAAKRIMSNK